MIDHELGRRERIDGTGSAPQRDHGLAHRCEIDHGRHAGEVLQDDAARREGNLGAGFGRGIPAGQRQDVVPRDVAAVFMAQQVFSYNFV